MHRARHKSNRSVPTNRAKFSQLPCKKKEREKHVWNNCAYLRRYVCGCVCVSTHGARRAICTYCIREHAHSSCKIYFAFSSDTRYVLHGAFSGEFLASAASRTRERPIHRCAALFTSRRVTRGKISPRRAPVKMIYIEWYIARSKRERFLGVPMLVSFVRSRWPIPSFFFIVTELIFMQQ